MKRKKFISGEDIKGDDVDLSLKYDDLKHKLFSLLKKYLERYTKKDEDTDWNKYVTDELNHVKNGDMFNGEWMRLHMKIPIGFKNLNLLLHVHREAEKEEYFHGSIRGNDLSNGRLTDEVFHRLMLDILSINFPGDASGDICGDSCKV